MEPIKGYARILAAQPLGIGAELVTIEADLSRGLHTFSIVGLADKAVSEARERISSAIKHAGLKSPKSTNRRIVLSLSPASLHKDGSQYDLPLAIAFLAAAGFVQAPRERMLFCGELGLDGNVRPLRSVLAHALCAQEAGIGTIFVPAENAQEALLVKSIRVYSVSTLREVLDHLNGTAVLAPVVEKSVHIEPPTGIDFGDIFGQESAKRALVVAAAGRHSVILYGPPGTGKTMLARALPTIVPPLTKEETLAATSIHAAAGELISGSVVARPPFRAPHHSISMNALIGGSQLRPGEISLAHTGILFMDEFIEFDARTLEALRQPLEDKVVTIVRTKGAITFPSDVMLVAAMNPADTLSSDDATIRQKASRQSRKLSRPIIDRIDIWIEVPRVPYALKSISQETSSEIFREMIIAARDKGSALPDAEFPCAAEARSILANAIERLSLSSRGEARTLRVARTIALLACKDRITAEHVLEALQYRPKAPFV